MNSSFSKLLILILLPSMVFGQSLQKKSEDLALSDGAKNGRLAFHALNVSTGEVVVSLNSDKKMIPASNMKLLTTYAAIDILGPDHVFETSFGYSGVIAGGELQGDLVIQGGGDPTFGSSHFKNHHGGIERIMQDVVSALKDLGVVSIKGKIRVDESYYTGQAIPSGYPWDDVGNYYAAGAHALTVMDNTYYAFLDSKSLGGNRVQVTHTEPKISWPLSCEVEATDVKSDMAYFYPDMIGGMVIRGEIPRNRTAFKVKGAIPDPGAFFAELLEGHLSKVGIALGGDEGYMRSSGETTVIGFHYVESPTLLEIVKHTNMKSNNLFAEHLLRQIGKERANEGSFSAGIKEVEKWLDEKGIDHSGLTMKDGSGLSRGNTVSVSMMANVMKSLRQEPYYRNHAGAEGFMYGLPVAGVSGGMKRMGKGSVIQGKMRAKTGYIGGVRSYTGAVVNVRKEVIVFSLMANDHDLSASGMRIKLNDLLVGLGK